VLAIGIIRWVLLTFTGEVAHSLYGREAGERGVRKGSTLLKTVRPEWAPS
jgi:hypothetical protein